MSSSALTSAAAVGLRSSWWLAAAALIACSSAPSRPSGPPAAAPPVTVATPVTVAPAPSAAAGGASSAGTAPASGAPAALGAPAAGGATPGLAGTVSSAAAVAAPVVHPPVPLDARAEFDRAVEIVRQGNTSEAELEFQQLALQYPQFAAPLVNVAILKRKQGQLEAAEQLLKTAVAHESGSAVAWTELGATQSMRGEFKDAAGSYERAIGADPRFAPAWRNLGVVADLYLGEPQRALGAFEHYQQLTGEEKPVSGWIAELRQRLGIAPAKKPAAEAATSAAAAAGAAEPQPDIGAGARPAPTAPAGTPAPPPDAAPAAPAKEGN